MYKLLSQIQKEKFLEVSGIEYDGSQLKGDFSTPYPFNNREWTLSPWKFSFVFEEETGNLFCELMHRMTNNRVFGWDYAGNELSKDFILKYFKSDY
jgi:hypothetical protein